MGGGGGGGRRRLHHPLHNFIPEVGGGRLHGNGRLQGTLQYYKGYSWVKLRVTAVAETGLTATLHPLHVCCAKTHMTLNPLWHMGL